MNKPIDRKEVERVAWGIRKRVLEHTVKNKGGYLSQACSSAEIFSVLYTAVMKLDKPSEPLKPKSFPGVPSAVNSGYFTGADFNGRKAPELDRFFLSPAQYALVLYAALIETGRMTEDGLTDFNRDGSSVEMIGAEHSPGMEVMTGSLGQGISQAAGTALARKLKGEQGRVFVFMSDGEFQSGQTMEALQAMAFHKLDNMVVYVDVNGCQCDGKMDTVMNIEPFDRRLEAFGLDVAKIDGHDILKLYETGERNSSGRPKVVLAYTDPCKGFDILKQRYPKFHYVRFNSEEEMEKYRDFYNSLD